MSQTVPIDWHVAKTARALEGWQRGRTATSESLSRLQCAIFEISTKFHAWLETQGAVGILNGCPDRLARGTLILIVSPPRGGHPAPSRPARRAFRSTLRPTPVNFDRLFGPLRHGLRCNVPRVHFWSEHTDTRHAPCRDIYPGVHEETVLARAPKRLREPVPHARSARPQCACRRARASPETPCRHVFDPRLPSVAGIHNHLTHHRPTGPLSAPKRFQQPHPAPTPRGLNARVAASACIAGYLPRTAST